MPHSTIAAILAALLARPRRATRHIVANVLVSLQDKTHASANSQISVRRWGVRARIMQGDQTPEQMALPGEPTQPTPGGRSELLDRGVFVDANVLGRALVRAARHAPGDGRGHLSPDPSVRNDPNPGPHPLRRMRQGTGLFEFDRHVS
jgi:hypothetical protein